MSRHDIMTRAPFVFVGVALIAPRRRRVRRDRPLIFHGAARLYFHQGRGLQQVCTDDRLSHAAAT